MEEHIWEWGELTPDVVRAWGYDEHLLLMEQDEDLLLYKFEFFPVLLELAGDDRCPKQEYAFCILCSHSREQVTRGGERGTTELRAAWSAIPEPAAGRPRQWHQFVGRLLAYTQPSGPVDQPTARRMAEELLLGIAGRVGQLNESSPVRAGWWRFTLRTSVTEHVDVCAATGAFTYTPGTEPGESSLTEDVAHGRGESMLPLDDRRWSKVSDAYGKADDVIQWLRELRQAVPNLDGDLGGYDYYGSLCHQYTVYTATYAAIPHLIDLARLTPPDSPGRMTILSFVGFSVACAKLPRTDKIPKFLQRDYAAALQAAIPLIAESLPHATDDSDHAPNLRALFAAMAAIKGFAGLAFILADMECSIECPSCGGFIEPFECNLNLLAERPSD